MPERANTPWHLRLVCYPLALLGWARAQRWIGGFYFRAKAVPFDRDKAKYWLGKAAGQGDAQAQYLLGRMDYEDLESLEELIHYNSQDRADWPHLDHDPAIAIYWLRKAAGQGHSEARRLLDIMNSAYPR